MLRNRPLRLVVAALTLSLVASSCAKDAQDTPNANANANANANNEIVLDLDEFTFGTSGLTVKAGETLTFILTNVGVVQHELMIGQSISQSADGAPNGFEHDFFEGTSPVADPPSAAMFMGAADHADGDDTMDMSGDDTMDMSGDDTMDMGGDDHAGYMVSVAVGETVRVTVTIPDDAIGEWTIGCFEGDGSHFDAGMHTKLTVTA